MWCRLKRVKSISLILVNIMLWHFGGFGVLAQTRPVENREQAKPASRSAPKARDESRFDAFLGELKDVVKRGAEQTKIAPEKGFAGIDKLTELKGKLIAENEKNQQQFDQLESSLRQKGMPGEMLSRHAQSVREYEAKYAVLMARLESIESAQNQNTGIWAKVTGEKKEVNWDAVLGKTLRFLDDNAPRSAENPFDAKSLPHRSMKIDTPIPPKLTREDWLKAFPEAHVSAAQASVPPSASKAGTSSPLLSATPQTPADLAETIEVKFTPEIRQLADSLGKNPVKIYNWVRNNIEFVPTWGSIQGAQLCLENRAGNAFDTASLLIALLRYSGVRARYQMGTIEVPVDRFMNWAGGFTNIEAAASLFASAGVPSVVRRVNQSGQVVTVKLEHIWVKGFVDHAPSSGAMHAQGDAWIDLDPSFKQYDFPPPVNLSQFVKPADPVLFFNQVVAPATVNQNTSEVSHLDLALVRSTLQPDEAAVLNYLTTNFPQKSLREIIGVGKVVPTDLSVLAAALPYRIVVRGVTFADVPTSLRHSLEIALADKDGSQLLSFAQSLPTLSSSRIVFGYTPASDADTQAMTALLPSGPQQPLPQTIPAGFINMRPELKIDGQVVSTASAARLGVGQSLRMKFTAPTIQTPAVVNPIMVGESFGISLDLQQIPNNALASIGNRLTEISSEVTAHPEDPNISPREIQDLLLCAMSSGWFRQADLINQIAAHMFGVVSLRYPSAGIAFSDVTPATLFGTVHRITFGRLAMDVDRDIVVTVSKSGSSQAAVHHTLAMGMIGSALEGSVPAQFLHSAGDATGFWLTTTTALARSQDLGGTLVPLSPNNFPLVAPHLGLPSSDLRDIEDALNAGMTVMVHEGPLRDRDGKDFVGYIQFDPLTGSGSYMVGGLNGAEMAQCIPPPLTINPQQTTGSLLSAILGSASFSAEKFVVKSYVDALGGPAGLVGKSLSLIRTMERINEGQALYLSALSAIGPAAQPLLGLVVLLAGLSLLKDLFLGLPFGVNAMAGAYLSAVAWTAYNLAIQMINRIVVIDAAMLGIQFEPDCLTRPAFF